MKMWLEKKGSSSLNDYAYGLGHILNQFTEVPMYTAPYIMVHNIIL